MENRVIEFGYSFNLGGVEVFYQKYYYEHVNPDRSCGDDRG